MIMKFWATCKLHPGYYPGGEYYFDIRKTKDEKHKTEVLAYEVKHWNERDLIELREGNQIVFDYGIPKLLTIYPSDSEEMFLRIARHSRGVYICK